ncbi:MAG: isoleucine--tRNA ligase [Acidimicrobiales bacterium]
MPFGPLESALSLRDIEERAIKRWRDLDLAARVTAQRAEGPPWVFYEGPPTANGRPGLHHVWARVFKDLFPRFQTMRGHHVPRKGGWDCHGLPVEIEVERELGLSSKAEIESYGIDRFNQRCRESVARYVADWEALTERAGVWIDTADAYWTLSDDYIESVWWLLAEMFDRGLLYEGHRVVPYCSRCGTALSSHELGQPGAYRQVVDRSVYVRFPLLDEAADLVVWTTTPWTLVANVAVAAGPEVEYARIADPGGGRDLIMAVALAPEGAQIRERFAGSQLAGRAYQRPLEMLGGVCDPTRVVLADFVTVEEGSGLVHLAPAFGADDLAVAREAALPVVNPLGPDGLFGPEAADFAGMGVAEATGAAIDLLSASGLLVREEAYEHSYPHCWRCSTPLVYWAKTSWFVATSARRDQMLAENERIDWHPAHIRHGRFGDWLANNVDWALSRDRYWGTPLPIWRCAAGHDTAIGSRSRLASLAGMECASLDLHRPAVDKVTFACPQCGQVAQRVTPVLDAWFDSGSMPSAQHHHPFGGGDPQAPASYPADFICEAIDQTRGWFYSLLAVNTLIFGSSPYRSVVCLGLLVDENGQKMSKSRGNVIDPWDIFNRFGADALRWYFFASGSPWSARRVSPDAIAEASRPLVTLWNVFAGFFVTYADLEAWTPSARDEGLPRLPGTAPGSHVLDRWLLARLESTTAAMTAALEDFDAALGAEVLGVFIDDLSNWYVRRSRSRFWGPDAPFGVLHFTLVTLSTLLAPYCPFLADEIYRVLTGKDSVHLADWPLMGAGSASTQTAEVDAAAPLRSDLEQQMAAARRLVGLGRQAREQSKVPTRQPLRRALLLHPGEAVAADVAAEIAQELNVKTLEQVADLGDLLTWKAVPNFRALGPRLGTRMGDVAAGLTAMDGTEVRRELGACGSVSVAGEVLGEDDVELRPVQHPGFSLAQEGTWAVALDLTIDDELRREGTARQISRLVNEVRKQAGLGLADRIRLHMQVGEPVRSAIDDHREWVAAQVLATELTIAPSGEADVNGSLAAFGREPYATEVEVDSQTVRVTLAVI